MTMQDKTIAIILLLHGSLGILWTFWTGSHIGSPAVFILENLVLAAIGIAAGIGWFRRRRWAIYLGTIFFLVQVVQVLTPTFRWSFTLGFNVIFSLGWLSTGEFGINLFALVMLFWLGMRAFVPNQSSKRTREKPRAA